MRELTCKLLILGAGPGGYVCAIRAGQLGVDTIVVDPQPPGGTCLNMGCIPSKALIEAANTWAKLQSLATKPAMGIHGAPGAVLDFAATQSWKNGIVSGLNQGISGLLRKARVRLIAGEAMLRDGKTAVVQTPEGQLMIRAEAVVLATGSEPSTLPGLPFGGKVISSTEALSLREVPRHLVVAGGGYIGLELGTAFAKLGAQVTVLEAGPRILPQYDEELTAPVRRHLQALGVRLLTNARAGGLSPRGDLRVALADGAEELTADQILVTIGRRPRSAVAGIPELNLAMNGAFIAVDDRCRTSMRGVYAVGDLTGDPMLAHRAMAQGEMVAGLVAGQSLAWDKRAIPEVCFTDPNIISVGLSPDAARAQGAAVTIGQFPFSANSKAMIGGRTDGFIRVVCRQGSGEILGLQGVGEGLADISAAFALAVENGLLVGDLAATIHAHPTRSEALVEAALRAEGLALHI